QARRQDERAHAALVVVVGALQQGGGLPGVHRRVVEVQLGQGLGSGGGRAGIIAGPGRRRLCGGRLSTRRRPGAAPPASARRCSPCPAAAAATAGPASGSTARAPRTVRGSSPRREWSGRRRG